MGADRDGLGGRQSALCGIVSASVRAWGGSLVRIDDGGADQIVEMARQGADRLGGVEDQIHLADIDGGADLAEDRVGDRVTRAPVIKIEPEGWVEGRRGGAPCAPAGAAARRSGRPDQTPLPLAEVSSVCTGRADLHVGLRAPVVVDAVLRLVELGVAVALVMPASYSITSFVRRRSGCRPGHSGSWCRQLPRASGRAACRRRRPSFSSSSRVRRISALRPSSWLSPISQSSEILWRSAMARSVSARGRRVLEPDRSCDRAERSMPTLAAKADWFLPGSR